MEKRPRWLFHVSSLPRLGGGHITRSLQLAEAMRDDADIDFLLDTEDGPWHETVHGRGFCVLNGFPDTPDYNAVWVDHYEPNLKQIRSLNLPVAGIIDLAHNIGLYDFMISYVPNPAMSSSSFSYALIDPEYARIKHIPSPHIRLAVNFGQTDSKQATLKVLNALEHSPEALHVNVVCGKTNAQKDTIAQMVERSRHDMTLTDAPPNLKSVFAQTDLFITAGGVTVLEACAAGVPCLTIATADNQMEQVMALSRAGAILYCGMVEDVTSEMILNGVQTLMPPQERARISDYSRALIDGNGAQRVADALRAWERQERHG